MSTLYVDNLEPNLGSRVLAAGHVVQVVQATHTTQTELTTTATWTRIIASCPGERLPLPCGILGRDNAHDLGRSSPLAQEIRHHAHGAIDMGKEYLVAGA